MTQRHAGKKMKDGNSIWHTNSDGTYWSGWMPDSLTPEEIYYACSTTVADLLALHPDLLEKMRTGEPVTLQKG